MIIPHNKKHKKLLFSVHEKRNYYFNGIAFKCSISPSVVFKPYKNRSKQDGKFKYYFDLDYYDYGYFPFLKYGWGRVDNLVPNKDKKICFSFFNNKNPKNDLFDEVHKMGTIIEKYYIEGKTSDYIVATPYN